MKNLILRLIKENLISEKSITFDIDIEEIRPSFENLLKFIPDETDAIEVFVSIYKDGVNYGSGIN